MHEIPSNEREHLLYLSQIDAQLTTFTSRSASFFPDLINRLLLESGAVITDVFFFISPEIADDLRREDQSWIFHGLRRKLIVPAFREKGVHSFRENWERSGMSNNMGVIGGGENTLLQLDAAVRDRGTPRITWPSRVGVSFGKIIDREFRRDSVDTDLWRGEQFRLWDKTKGLREKYLELGWQQVRDRDQHGLRRADLHAAIANDVGFRGKSPADTAAVIACADSNMRESLNSIYLWIDELYHYNHADRFQVKPSFPITTGPGAMMLPGLLWKGPANSPKISETWMYRHAITWPSSSALQRTSPDWLLGLRSEGPGKAYEEALNKFRKNPDDENWHSFKVSANSYAKLVCKAVGSQVSDQLEIRHLVANKGLSLGTVLASTVGDFVAHGFVHEVSLVTSAVGTMYIACDAFRAARATTGKVQLAIEGRTTKAKAGGRKGEVKFDMPAAG